MLFSIANMRVSNQLATSTVVFIFYFLKKGLIGYSFILIKLNEMSCRGKKANTISVIVST
jgi:hypothetical protein